MSDEHEKESRRKVRICKPEVHTQPELALVELLVSRLFGPSCLVPNVLRVKHGELPCARVRVQVQARALRGRGRGRGRGRERGRGRGAATLDGGKGKVQAMASSHKLSLEASDGVHQHP